MARLDWRRRLAFLPAQTPGLPEAAGLRPADLADAAWALPPSGAARRGAAAILTALDATVPRGLPLFSVWLHLRPVAAVADAVYAWVARSRHRFPGRARLAAGPAPALQPETAAEIERRLEAEPHP